MKKPAITGILILFIFAAIAGENTSIAEISENTSTDATIMDEVAMPASYIGLSSGINFGGMVAITGDFGLSQKTSIAPSLGLGAWGYKLGLDFRFYRTQSVGRFFSLGIGRSTGLPEPLEIEAATTRVSSGEEVSIKYDPVNNLNLGMGYAWKIGTRSRFVLDFGYAIKITPGDGYEVLSGETLNDASKMAMSWLRPGGLRLGLGIHLGL